MDRLSLSQMTTYLDHVSKYLGYSTNERIGQAHFNVLYKLHPELANQIRATDKDPFYKDERLADFMEEISDFT